MAKGGFVSFGMMLAGLALAACAGGQRQQAVPPAAIPTPIPAVTATALPTGSSPSQPPGGTSSDLNRKLLSQLSPAEDGDLPLGPGDLIEVSVFEVPELSSLKFRLPNSGDITLPLIGTVPAAGLTPVELQAAIRARLQEKYMHDPQVSLFVHEHKSQRISVIGAVRSGGVFTLTGRLRLADALAMGGGLAEDAAPMVYLIRRVPAADGASTQAGGTVPKDHNTGTGDGAPGQVMTIIDLQSLVAGRQELNLPLQAGDILEVPRAGSYYVGGEVNRPGSFPLKPRTTLDQAPVVAGGVREAADWDDIRVYRARADGMREVLTFSLNEFEKGKPAPEIQTNDVIIVGKSYTKAFLYSLRDIFKFGIGAGATLSIPVQ